MKTITHPDPDPERVGTPEPTQSCDWLETGLRQSVDIFFKVRNYLK
jgi:hypothetical protein